MDLIEAVNRNDAFDYRHPWELSRLDIVKYVLKKLVKGQGFDEVYLIDIGCGDLFVLEELHSYFNFKSSIGIDTAIDQVALEACNLKYKDQAISVFNTLQAVNIPNGAIAIVILLDVIEHIEDDRGFVSELTKSSFVNMHTRFLITVPSFSDLYCSHDTYLLHFRRYNNLGLTTLFEENSFEVVQRGYLFFSLLFPRLVKVFLEKSTRKRSRTSYNGSALTTWNHGEFITHMIKNILFFDCWVLMNLSKIGVRLPGLSNYVICKKNV